MVQLCNFRVYMYTMDSFVGEMRNVGISLYDKKKENSHFSSLSARDNSRCPA